LFSKIRWKLNEWKNNQLRLLNFLRIRLTVIDGFGALGDTLLTAIVIRNLKKRYPRIRINCITPNPDLVRMDPNIESLNDPETYFSVTSWYIDIRNARDGGTNVLAPTLKSLDIRDFEYKAEVHLDQNERNAAERFLKDLKQPLVSINCQSKEEVKNWPVGNWQELVATLGKNYSIVQLGGDTEPNLKEVALRLAGKLTPRESLAVLSHCSLHVGPDSFLVHGANGLDVPSVVIYGGSRTPKNLGYPENANLATSPSCSPCWIHEGDDETCQHDIQCLRELKVSIVLSNVLERLKATNAISTSS
jgi:ADP-heptose:LPS heptosyltransferase